MNLWCINQCTLSFPKGDTGCSYGPNMLQTMANRPNNVMTEFLQSTAFTPVVICHCGDDECCLLILGNLINEKHLS